MVICFVFVRFLSTVRAMNFMTDKCVSFLCYILCVLRTRFWLGERIPWVAVGTLVFDSL